MGQSQAEEQLGALVGILVHTAQELLKSQRGEFIPFGAFVNAEGQPEMLSADTNSGAERLRILDSAFRSMVEQQRIIMSGIAINVRARLPGYDDQVDAICCQLDGKEMKAIQFFVPYRKGIFGYKFDKGVILPGEKTIFPAV